MFFDLSFENPILVPESDLPWEAEGAFNGSVLSEKGMVHMVYRAQSLPHLHDDGHWLSLLQLAIPPPGMVSTFSIIDNFSPRNSSGNATDVKILG